MQKGGACYVNITESGSKSIHYDIAAQGRKRRFGSMKGQKFIVDGHDIDECNDEIARLFPLRAGMTMVHGNL